jgi:uncharacterized membrane protein
MQKQKRLLGIDVFRGWAIFLMVIFHLSYDLQYFKIIDFHIQTNIFFIWFRFLIVSMFLLTVGISLKLAHQKRINWSKIKKRSLQLILASVAVTIVSYIIFPNMWIYFGILHFILLSSFILLPLLNYPYTALTLAISIFIGFQLGVVHMHWLFQLLMVPLNLPPTISVDIVRFFPWVSFILIGMAMGTLNWHTKVFDNNFFNREDKKNNFFRVMGRHALIIYLVHQPLIFGVFLLIKKTVN